MHVVGVVIIVFVIVIIIVFVHPMVHLVVLRKRGRNTMKGKLTRTRSFLGECQKQRPSRLVSLVFCVPENPAGFVPVNYCAYEDEQHLPSRCWLIDFFIHKNLGNICMARKPEF